MTENTLSTANLTAPEQRARLLKLLAQKERETKFAPLSFSQERFWLQEQLAPGSISNLSLSARIRGRLDVSILEQSLTEIVRRHESLRTTFVMVSGQPMQSIKPPQPFRLSLITLEQIPADMRVAEAKHISTEELGRPFDLVQGPLFRVTLLRLAAHDHVMIVITQHLVSDAWSLSVLVQELSVLYEAFSSGRPLPLPPLPFQYADFAQWQRENAQGEVLKRELAYWTKQISGSATALAIPTDRPRSLAQTTRGARETLILPLALREQLKALAQQEGSTLFMVLLAGLQILLQRYTRQEDIGVYTLVANRTANAVEKLIGLFLNTLLLRVDLSGNPTCIEVLHQARQITLEAYDHQTIPFQILLEALQAQGTLQRAPSMQVLLLLQNVPYPVIKLSDLDCERFVREMDFQSDLELSFSLVESDDGLSGWVEYQTDLYDAATIRRILQHYQRLLTGIVEDPYQRIADLALLTTAERQVLLDWNNTCIHYPDKRCLHEMFAAQAERTPEAIAVVFEDQHLTYRGLKHRATQLACHLQKLGVGPETLVGLCLERSLEMVIGLFGILKAGGAYVPLDPTYPRDRLAYMLENARGPVLLTQSWLVENLPQHGTHVICLDTDWASLAHENATDSLKPLADDRLAYVIYTSGSTGQPKGVMNTQRGILNRLLWMQAMYQLTVADRILQKTPFSFDVSVWEFFWPLMTGACLVVARPEGHKDSAYLVQLIREQFITTLHFVPSMLQVFVQEPELEACTSLKRVICSGEALPFDLQEHFWERQRAELHNLYGPTEAAVDVTYWACTSTSPYPIVPIGKPIANIQIYILDPNLQPTPIGVPGELHIGGIGLARGYLNRPELTAERFIPHPFSSVPGARLYRTGDLARYLPDGSIEFLGRLDFQVKVRGFRIELGEIEAALRQYPNIRDAVVIAYTPAEKAAGPLAAVPDKQLVAYLAVDSEHPPAIDDLREWLRQRLPAYMLPATFMMLATLPLTASGKIDRRALPAPALDTPEKEYIPPTTPVEKKLAEIWAQVLHRGKISLYDNFLELGGHSLLATQVIFRVNQVFRLNLTLPSLFEEPTLAGLALLIEEHVLEEIDSSLKREEGHA